MRRITLLSLLLLGAVAAGCTDGGASLVILQNQVPNASCVPPSNQGATFRSSGVVDVTSPGGYLFFPLVQNIAEAIRDDDSARVVFMEGFDVELLYPTSITTGASPDALAAIGQFSTVFASGPVSPGDTTAFAVEIIGGQALAALAGPSFDSAFANGGSVQVTAIITAFGKMDGGTIESQEFRYPITIYKNFLKNTFASCADVPAGFSAAQGFECSPYLLQDAFVDCCINNGTELCPAVHIEPDPV